MVDARRRIVGYGVHLFTASGAALGFLALACAAEGAFAAMFGLLGVALLVDGLDGALARVADTPVSAPAIDGAVLDLVVDFVTYVVTPFVALWRSNLMTAPLSLALGALGCAASALYFADRRMKTADLWFRGFPACWNMLALYLFALRPPPFLCAAIIVLGCALLFAPFAAVHPMRVRRLRGPTLAVTALWLACAAWLVATDFGASPWPRAGLCASGLYFVALSFWRGAPGDAMIADKEERP